jgi:hypothetical protein
MVLRDILFAGLTLGLLAGCGEAPVPTPIMDTGPLQGRIEQGSYYDKRGWFTVGLPFKPGEPEFPYIEMREEYPTNISYVSFSPLADPGEYYRVYMEDFTGGGRKMSDMDTLADAAVRFFGKQLTDARLEPMRLVKEEAWQTGGTRGIIRFYTETAPSSQVMFNLGMDEDYTAYIVIYLTEKAGKVAVTWAEWPHDCKVCQPTPPVEDAPSTDDPIATLLAGNARAAAFIASLRYTDTAGAAGQPR